MGINEIYKTYKVFEMQKFVTEVFLAKHLKLADYLIILHFQQIYHQNDSNQIRMLLYKHHEKIENDDPKMRHDNTMSVVAKCFQLTFIKDVILSRRR